MYNIVLASNSPRRKELLAGLGLEFVVRVIDGIDESYPDSLPAADVAQYIAEKKADAYRATLQPDEMIITADTVVIVGDDILGKPADAADAARMLREISGRTHQVTTGVSLLTADAASTSVSAPELLITIVLFCAVYLLLFVAWIRITGKFIKAGPDAAAANPDEADVVSAIVDKIAGTSGSAPTAPHGTSQGGLGSEGGDAR